MRACVRVREIEIQIVLPGLKMALVQYINGVSDVGEGVLRGRVRKESAQSLSNEHGIVLEPSIDCTNPHEAR